MNVLNLLPFFEHKMINIQNKFYSLFALVSVVFKCEEIGSQNRFNLRFAEKEEKNNENLFFKRKILNHLRVFFHPVLCLLEAEQRLIANRHHVHRMFSKETISIFYDPDFNSVA